MDIAEEIYKQVRRLPESLAREVLDFVEYIEHKHELKLHGTDHLKEAQVSVMKRIWDNAEDEVWNDM